MSDILFGQSYYLRFDSKLWRAMQPYPPLGTMYAASYLRERGYDVALFDAMLAESEAAWDDALVRHKPRFAVLYEDNFNYLSKMCLLRMREAALTMIRIARARNCTVIVSGADATDHADLYLAQGAEFVLIGEGEYTLGELMDRLSGKSDFPLDTIRGMTFTDAGNRSATIRTLRREDIRVLDDLPFPAWDLIDVDLYRTIWYKRHGYYSANMVTSRGCPYHCAWCAKPIWGQQHNARTPENVVGEMDWLKETLNPDHIWFADDILGVKPGWIERFADLVEQHDVRIPFKSLHRADLLLRGGTIQALKRAGARTVWLGAESGSQRILDAMEKGARVEQIYEAAQILHQVGIEVCFFLQFGYLSEGREDIEATRQMIRHCRPEDIGVSVSYPLPGTRFYERVKAQLGAKQNWTDSSDLDVMYQGTFSSAYYRKLHSTVHKEFRARKIWDALRRQIRRPSQLRLHHMRQVAILAYYLATLPLDRLRLEILQRGGKGISLSPQGMRPKPAAQASAQPDSGKRPDVAQLE